MLERNPPVKDKMIKRKKTNLDVCALKCLKLPVMEFMQQGTKLNETLNKKLL